MTDPVQVVAEARCVLPIRTCGGTEGGFKHPECAVAALREAGALMPGEASALQRRNEVQAECLILASNDMARLVEEGRTPPRVVGAFMRQKREAVTAQRRADALLQEVRGVLGHWHFPETRTSPERNRAREVCRTCLVSWPCPEASLAERIGKVLG